jgi:predicted RNA-binding protein associated with RNAse of E/G family
MPQVTVRKLDHAGREVTTYPGQVLRREDNAIVLRTTWERPLLDLGFVLLETGSRWTEYFYADRWYNIFQIHAADGHLLGWYCNVTRPARITDHEVVAEDLALDLWVAADGAMRVLDEDEFAALLLSPPERQSAQQALAELQAMVSRRAAPFDGIDSDG